MKTPILAAYFLLSFVVVARADDFCSDRYAAHQSLILNESHYIDEWSIKLKSALAVAETDRRRFDEFNVEVGAAKSLLIETLVRIIDNVEKMHDGHCIDDEKFKHLRESFSSELAKVMR